MSDGGRFAPTHPRIVAGSLARRFEAVIFQWDGQAHRRQAGAPAIWRLVEELCRLGCDVGVMSASRLEDVEPHLRARPDGPGRLHLCLDRGAEIFRVSAAGIEAVFRRSASAREELLLDRAAQLTVEELREWGQGARLLAHDGQRRRIDLVLAEPVGAAAERTLAPGVQSMPGAVAIALQASHEVRLRDPRVVGDCDHVEIGLTDHSDSLRWLLREVGSRGIGPGLVLVVGDQFGPLAGLPGRDSRLLIPEARRCTFASIGREPAAVPAGVVDLPGGQAALRALLGAQVAHRRSGTLPSIDLDPGWVIVDTAFRPETELATEARLSIADGRIATNGSPLAGHRNARPLVLAAGIYTGEGSDSELMACPDWRGIGDALDGGAPLERVLDLRTGCLTQSFSAGGVTGHSFQFSSLARPGTTALRLDRPDPGQPDHGAPGVAGHGGWLRQSAAASGGVTVAGGERTVGPGIALERLAVFLTDPATVPAPRDARIAWQEARRRGFEQLLAEHRAAWARRWSEADISISGDRDLQLALRFAMFHLMGQAGDSGEAAVGARGLSGPTYHGHVFWDTDVFVLPFFAVTHPASARALLEYRLRRLPAAQALARAARRRGARFPWESARTGEEVTPTYGRDRRGRRVAILTGRLEEHIVADVAWAASTYGDWTGDDDFITGAGRPLLIETARYWASRIEVDAGGGGHISRVIGPDEYHEVVDDNAFTNVMARWNLRRAARLAESDPGLAAEAAEWRAMATALVDGYDPETGLYEQFRGFWGLEPLIIAELIPDRPVSADDVLGRARVQRAQVIKQPDVLMLHHLVPEETVPGSLLSNLDYYEPRTAHGSSLSPGIHAALLARAGLLEEAVNLVRLTSRLDLDDISGSTSGGLHLAAMGSLWQAIVFGFAGARMAGSRLRLDPKVPAAWDVLEVPLRVRGAMLRVRADPEHAVVDADRPTTVDVAGAGPVVVSRRPLRLRSTARGWRVTR